MKRKPRYIRGVSKSRNGIIREDGEYRFTRTELINTSMTKLYAICRTRNIPSPSEYKKNSFKKLVMRNRILKWQRDKVLEQTEASDNSKRVERVLFSRLDLTTLSLTTLTTIYEDRGFTHNLLDIGFEVRVAVMIECILYTQRHPNSPLPHPRNYLVEETNR